MIRQIVVSVLLYDLHDIRNTQLKFDNNRSGSFEDYLFHKKSTQTTDDNQTERRGLFFRSLGIVKYRKNMKAGIFQLKNKIFFQIQRVITPKRHKSLY